MKPLLFLLCLLFLFGCNSNERDLASIKKDFIKEVLDAHIEEGPFHMNYSLRTVFFSKEVVSLFGEIHLYAHLPHGITFYEGKTYCKINNKYREITLDSLLNTPEQKEFLRQYCEADLKQQPCSYFSGNEPLCIKLEIKALKTFVVDDQFLILIFQPYSVGGFADGPFSVKIALDELRNHWNPENPLATLLPSEAFVSSWDQENWISKPEI